MALIFDNRDEEHSFTRALNERLFENPVKRVDFCVGYFNIRGWDMIMDQVDNLTGDDIEEGYERKRRYCRLLIGMHQPDRDLLERYYGIDDDFSVDNDYKTKCRVQIAQEFKKQLLIGLPTKKDKFTIMRLVHQLREDKVCVKLYTEVPVHAKLYIAHYDSTRSAEYSLMGSSNLTYSGLTRKGELNIELQDTNQNQELVEWFEKLWNHRACIDITKELIEVLEGSWANQEVTPYDIYLKTAYHLSEEARSGIKEFTIPAEFRGKLFDFQENAVKIAAKHLNNDKRGGAMIGDVVGLGKTITACAIAKMWEYTYASSTLIICPANLQGMWKKYVNEYDLKADIMSMAKPIDVDNSRYYRLIIVDESHNLRNPQGSRYQNIHELISKQDCKVLLLTATPYNKDYRDLSSQLRLFIDADQDLGIRPEQYIEYCGDDHKFQRKHPDIGIRSIAAFEQSPYSDDWSELMKLFLVRRTRTFVKKYFAKQDPKNGRYYLTYPGTDKRSYFPTREPHSVKFDTVEGDQYSRLYSTDMLDLMFELKLPRYGLEKFIDTKKLSEATKREKDIAENLSRAGTRMMGFCKSTFFKRIDSSGYAFLLTLYRHVLRNYVYIYAIENGLPLPVSDENALPDDLAEDADSNEIIINDGETISRTIFDVPTDLKDYEKKAQQYYDYITMKNNVTWISSKLFKRTLKQDLKADSSKIIKMIELCGKWNPKEDQKLNRLEFLLKKEHKDDKVIVFTQYSDTADYIYNQLKERGIKSIECVTGNSNNQVELVERFSPISNKANINEEKELRILIATDVLSEGQNLQDAHVIVNFDLPWAIIRLIQRAGRVDRIGQDAENIDCYSFFPADGVENIIRLRTRLNERINQNANVMGNDEVFFEGNEQNLRDMYNEKSGVLDDEEDTDVDLTSYAYQIWTEATKANPELKSRILKLGNMVDATKETSDAMEEGVITYARTKNGYDVLSWVDKEGKVVSNSQKRILRAMSCAANTPSIPHHENHYELIKAAIKNVQETSTSQVAGTLGNRFSTRFKIYDLLDNYYNTKEADLFFTEDKRQQLKIAIDTIFNGQLLEQTKFMLGRMMRSRVSNDEIVDYVLELLRTGNLCNVDEDQLQSNTPSIICSMGMRKQD